MLEPAFSAPPRVTFALVGDPQYGECPSRDGRDYRGVPDRHHRLMGMLDDLDLDFVVNLGDLGDGLNRDEIPKLLESLAECRHPVRHVVGNHDLVLHTEDELKHLLGLEDFFYDFEVGGVRFVVINSLDISRFAPAGSARRAAYRRYKKENAGLELREWDGMLSSTSRAWLRGRLEDAARRGQTAVILAHIPVCPEASGRNTWMWDHRELLALLDDHPCVRAFFAGHYHPGGLALRNGVLHKTVRALCDAQRPTAIVCRVHDDCIELDALGEETPFVFRYDPAPVVYAGFAAPGAFITANTGELVRADANGAFRLTIDTPGPHTLKAVADGFDDVYVTLPNGAVDDLRLSMRPNARRRVVHGKTAPFAALRATDGDRPVRFFDLDGKPYGGLASDAVSGWHERGDHYWCRGEYAFGAEGEVRIETLPRHAALRERGWYKGDFHAHVLHGEKHYRVDLATAAFAARAEGYDWIAYDATDTGAVVDQQRLARSLSGPDFLLTLNNEFPKNANGHVAHLGVGPIRLSADPDRVSNFELARRHIAAAGGVALPVHPLYAGGLRRDRHGVYDNMLNKEVFLWLLCEPELCPCLDLFYNDDTPGALDYWYGLLRRGYRIGCAATSDAALDVGRSPGARRGATFVHSPRLDEAALAEAIRRRRTMVSWHGAALLMHIDDAGPGDVVAPGRGRRRLRLEAWYRPEAEVVVELVRDGECVARHEATLDESAHAVWEREIREKDNAFYLALLYERNDPGRVRAAVSPVFFRDERFAVPKTYPFPSPMPRGLRMRMREATFDELRSLDFLDELARRLHHETHCRAPLAPMTL